MVKTDSAQFFVKKEVPFIQITQGRMRCTHPQIHSGRREQSFWVTVVVDLRCACFFFPEAPLWALTSSACKRLMPPESHESLICFHRELPANSRQSLKHLG